MSERVDSGVQKSSDVRGSSGITKFVAMAQSPRNAWLAIVLLQASVLWRIWELRDLPFGDTSSYFAEALRWNQNGRFDAQNLVFSPLYVAFLGLAQRAFADPFAAIMAHRMIILFGASAIMLGLLRVVLPPAIAWLMAAWWVLGPANPFLMHHYDVHVFGFATIALGCWLPGVGQSSWWRGSGLAALGAGALFVRNEFLPAYALFAGCCVIYETWRWREKRAPLAELSRQAAAVLLPSVAFVLVLSAWLTRGLLEPELHTKVTREFEFRHQANLVQVYPFGYQQRHADWQKDPWHEGSDLLQRDFGSPALSLSQAMVANPRAVWEHIWWNFKLLPAGLQLGLFGRHAGPISPDFVPTNGGRRAATWMGVAVAALWVAGLALRVRRQTRYSLQPSTWTWIALACCLPSLLVAIATQRPRPSYILLLLVILIALTGLAIATISARIAACESRRALTLHCACLAVLVAVALYFSERRPSGPLPRSILEAYHRLLPFRADVRTAFSPTFTNESFGIELLRYLGASDSGSASLDVQGAMSSGLSFRDAIGRAGVRSTYMTGSFLNREDVLAWRRTSEAAGWKVLAASSAPQPQWELWVLAAPPAAEPRHPAASH